ncbi:hypothetical protein [Micromonospora cathayae]|uniref:Condensation domain-containing protein n=1 Tax=Micromonospora cathayae TaxID=3028804 RepID=A0ABY7ZSH8_9ACTN|nr:hypothetical protein [Micromonospora sp. HUAS 3]WDZ85828.1 hypothetical protein PVK37_05180 [Micromonospora sp. HUAS 3]
MRAAWANVLARFGNLRTVFTVTSDGRVGRGVAAAGDATRATFARAEPADFFDVLCARLDLFDTVLTRLVVAVDRRETLLGVCFDHLVIDGTTVRMVLSALWAALRGEEPPDPPPLGDARFVRAELATAGSAEVDRILTYWRATTGGHHSYPAPHEGITRPAGVPARPETATVPVRLGGPTGLPAGRLGRAALLLSAVAVAFGRTTDGTAPRFVTLTQGARRAGRNQQRIAGFLSNWLLASVPVARSAAVGAGPAAQAMLAAMAAGDVHHAEVVRRLEPDRYGARYGPSTGLPPYSLFNYLQQLPEPRIDRGTGRTLTVPPVPGNILHGGLRVYGSEPEHGADVAVRVVADAGVYGAGFAAALAEAIVVATAP